MRNRAKDNFPMVLLTLLSIVQALALELLWDYVSGAEHLFAFDAVAVNGWIRIIATFQGLILIWVVYAANAMRFRWVPVTSDSVYPFVIGVLEFMLVETLDPGESGYWLLLMAVIFGTMVRVSHTTMRRARQDGDNDSFFSQFRPATPRDFVPQFIFVTTMLVCGAYLVFAGDDGIFAFVVLVAANGLLVYQFAEAAMFWRRTVGESERE